MLNRLRRPKPLRRPQSSRKIKYPPLIFKDLVVIRLRLAQAIWIKECQELPFPRSERYPRNPIVSKIRQMTHSKIQRHYFQRWCLSQQYRNQRFGSRAAKQRGRPESFARPEMLSSGELISKSHLVGDSPSLRRRRCGVRPKEMIPQSLRSKSANHRA